MGGQDGRAPGVSSRPHRRRKGRRRVRDDGQGCVDRGSHGRRSSGMAKQMGGAVVVVTGASSGVGRACARAFGARGARVALIARNEDALKAAADEIRREGGTAMVLPLDVADAASVEDAAARVQAEWGRIDVWVNNAMATVFAPVKDTTPDEFRRVTEVTYLGYVHGTLAALKRMLP